MKNYFKGSSVEESLGNTVLAVKPTEVIHCDFVAGFKHSEIFSFFNYSRFRLNGTHRV
jgi:hypothetical protein